MEASAQLFQEFDFKLFRYNFVVILVLDYFFGEFTEIGEIVVELEFVDGRDLDGLVFLGFELLVELFFGVGEHVFHGAVLLFDEVVVEVSLVKILV